MSWLLGILSILVFFVAFLLWGVSQTAIHEILVGILFIISAIFLSAAAIIGSINALKKEIKSIK